MTARSLLSLLLLAAPPRIPSYTPLNRIGAAWLSNFTLLADVAAPRPPGVNAAHHAAVDRALDKHWRSRSGHCHQRSDDSSCDAAEAGDEELTYGEITVLGSRQLALHMGLWADSGGGPAGGPGGGGNSHSHSHDDGDDGDGSGGGERGIVFADLGSGVGKLVVQMWLENAAVRHSVGIELSRTRHDLAVDAWASLRGLSGGGRGGGSGGGKGSGVDAATSLRRETLRSAGRVEYDSSGGGGGGGRASDSGGNDSGRGAGAATAAAVGVELVQGNILSPTLDLTTITHLYVAGLCFSASTVGELAAILRISEASLSRRIKLSIEEGLVSRHPFCGDGRANLIRLEPKGLEALNASDRVAREDRVARPRGRAHRERELGSDRWDARH